MANFPWLTTIILFPIAASLLIPVLPDKDGRTVRWYALSVGLIDFALIVYVFYSQYDFGNKFATGRKLSLGTPAGFELVGGC